MNSTMLNKYLEPSMEAKKKPNLDQEKLNSFLWSSANILRGAIDSSDYKQYIFGLMFLKRLSDQFDDDQVNIITKAYAQGLLHNEKGKLLLNDLQYTKKLFNNTKII